MGWRGCIRSSQKRTPADKGESRNSRATQKCDLTFNYVSFVVSSVLGTKSSVMFRMQQRLILWFLWVLHSFKTHFRAVEVFSRRFFYLKRGLPDFRFSTAESIFGSRSDNLKQGPQFYTFSMMTLNFIRNKNSLSNKRWMRKIKRRRVHLLGVFFTASWITRGGLE